MRKVLLLFVILMLPAILAGCQAREKVGEKTGELQMISYEGNDLQLCMKTNPSTGFSWIVVYKSDNVELNNIEYQNISTDPTASGAPVYERISLGMTGDGVANFIVKYARPWEGKRPWMFRSYIIKSENGKIVDVVLHEKMDSKDLHEISHEANDVVFGSFIPKAWEYKEYQDGNEVGFYLKPQDEAGYVRVFYAPSAGIEKAAFTEKPIKISETDVLMGVGTEHEPVYFLAESENIFCVIDEAAWQGRHFDELIEILDMSYYFKR